MPISAVSNSSFKSLVLICWFNEYFFTPLSILLRNMGISGVILASMTTFLILGLWHGASWGFVLFGGLQGLMLSIELITKKSRKKMRNFLPKFINDSFGLIFTFLFFSFALIFFRTSSVNDAFYVITHLFDNLPSSLTELQKQSFLGTGILTNTEFILTILVCFLIFAEHFVLSFFKMDEFFKNRSLLFKQISYALLIITIIFFGVFNKSQFIYFRF